MDGGGDDVDDTQCGNLQGQIPQHVADQATGVHSEEIDVSLIPAYRRRIHLRARTRKTSVSNDSEVQCRMNDLPIMCIASAASAAMMAISFAATVRSPPINVPSLSVKHERNHGTNSINKVNHSTVGSAGLTMKESRSGYVGNQLTPNSKKSNRASQRTRRRSAHS